MARILVVEDDAEIRQVLAQLLEGEGYDVSTAPNGLVGLAEAREHQPALILLDLMMPVMDGWTFLAVQMEDPRISGVPVVVLSAARGIETVNGGRCLSKPCSVDELLGAVERYRRRGDREGLQPT